MQFIPRRTMKKAEKRLHPRLIPTTCEKPLESFSLSCLPCLMCFTGGITFANRSYPTLKSNIKMTNEESRFSAVYLKSFIPFVASIPHLCVVAETRSDFAVCENQIKSCILIEWEHPFCLGNRKFKQRKAHFCQT